MTDTFAVAYTEERASFGRLLSSVDAILSADAAGASINKMELARLRTFREHHMAALAAMEAEARAARATILDAARLDTEK